MAEIAAGDNASGALWDQITLFQSPATINSLICSSFRFSSRVPTGIEVHE